MSDTVIERTPSGGTPATTVHILAAVISILSAFLLFFWFMASQYADLKVNQSDTRKDISQLKEEFAEIKAEQKEQGKEIRATYKMLDLGTQPESPRKH